MSKKILEEGKIRNDFIVIGTGAAYGPAKQWSKESYKKTAERCIRDFDCDIVLIGSNDDKALCDEIAQQDSRIHNLCGKTSLVQAALVLQASKCFIGNDSGLMHMAGLTGTPTLGLFFSTDDVRTSPLGISTTVLKSAIDCRPCLNRTCEIGYLCREKISPEDVLKEVSALISS